jgi:outer membrane biosynthesis protein TonB
LLTTRNELYIFHIRITALIYFNQCFSILSTQEYFMDELQKIRAALAVMEKHTSLRQVSIQSGINYITLRNIKSGKSGRVTDSVAARFNKFQEKFAASPAAVASPSKRNAAAPPPPTPAAKKPGPKPKAAGKKPGPKPKSVAAPAPVPAAAAPKKSGPKPKAGRKKAGRPAKPAAVSAPAPQQAAIPVSGLLGGTLTKEIAMAEARLDFLKQLQKLEADFLRKIGK